MISAVLPKMTTNFIFPQLHLHPLTCLTDDTVEVLSLCAGTIGSWFEPRISEFDPQRNTNEKSEFNKPALCYSSLYLMLLTVNSVPINSEMEMVRVQSALNMFTRSQIHMKSTGGVGSLDMDSALRSLQLFTDCLDVTAKIWHIKHNYLQISSAVSYDLHLLKGQRHLCDWQHADAFITFIWKWLSCF